METQCNEQLFNFQAQNRREVVAKFDGGTISTDGGALLLREAERLTGIIAGFAACFTDHRDPELIEHRVEHLVAQCDTIRLKLLKVGAQIRVTVRKVWVSLSQSWPYREIFAMVYQQLRNLRSMPLRC